jgi:hypothetical protein
VRRNTNADTLCEPDTHCYCNTHCDCHCLTYTIPDTYTHIYANSDSKTYTDAAS